METILFLFLIATLCTAQMELAITDDVRRSLCANSGGIWAAGEGCACQDGWVWQDAFGCKRFGANPQLECIKTGGKWKFYPKQGVNVCVCPSAEYGVPFDPVRGCVTVTPPEPTLREKFSLKYVSDSLNEWSNNLTDDMIDNPFKYIKIIMGLLVGLIIYRVVRDMLGGFDKPEREIIYIE
jgi:hypothetical protein